jgi:hypothetical protein
MKQADVFGRCLTTQSLGWIKHKRPECSRVIDEKQIVALIAPNVRKSAICPVQNRTDQKSAICARSHLDKSRFKA